MKWKVFGVIGVIGGTAMCYIGGLNEAVIVGLVGAVVALGAVIKGIFFPPKA